MKAAERSGSDRSKVALQVWTLVFTDHYASVPCFVVRHIPPPVGRLKPSLYFSVSTYTDRHSAISVDRNSKVRVGWVVWFCNGDHSNYSVSLSGNEA